MIIDDLLNMIRMNALCHYQTWESHRQTVVVDVNREETQKKKRTTKVKQLPTKHFNSIHRVWPTKINQQESIDQRRPT